MVEPLVRGADSAPDVRDGYVLPDRYVVADPGCYAFQPTVSARCLILPEASGAEVTLVTRADDYPWGGHLVFGVAGLLPDNEQVIQRWARTYQVSAGNPFALLRHVGEDCAGAAQFVPSHFRHPERRGETPVNVAWFAARGWTVDRLPDALDHEGAGDALPFTPEGGPTVLLSGYSFRSDASAATELSALLRCPVRPVQLVDPRLYHLDLTFCPLDGRRAMIAPLGWDAYGRKVVEALVPEPLVLADDEALSFCANSVVVGGTVVMPSTPLRVGRQLEAWGFDVVECRVDEFLKAGGGCRCLTLALDVVLSPGALPAPPLPTA